ncbi:MAG TPA: ABC transporter ATP-binding protein [Labilithrix sp.]|nr:ABC transporter ATP-binding protein [Labilithrix sp.]
MKRNVIVARSLCKTYRRGAHAVEALKDTSLEIDGGELVAIMGPSGSGKSTLLQLLGGLDRPTTGTVRFEQTELHGLTDHQMALFRRRRLGFIFQFFNLLPAMSVLDNVLLPLTLDGRADAVGRRRAVDLLGWLGLGARIAHKAHELSGGEMQRVAVARAVVTEPVALLADEPTGNLDTRAGAAVLELLARLADERGIACIMVTHDERAARYGTRLVRMRDGRIATDERTERPVSEREVTREVA